MREGSFRIVFERSPVAVLLLSVVTCGLYLIYWYWNLYEDFYSLMGQTPTGNEFALDLILALLTLGIWGIYMDYRISIALNALQEERNMPVRQTEIPVLILDLAAYVTFFLAFFLSSALQQDVLNRILRKSR